MSTNMNDEQESPGAPPDRMSLLERLIRFCLENRFAVLLMVFVFVGFGLVVVLLESGPRSVVGKLAPTDGAADTGKNQQIVFTEWSRRTPQDVEDQITYPLTVSLLGIPGVKTVRSYSCFGSSIIYVVFSERADPDRSRRVLLDKLKSLPASLLPEGVQPRFRPTEAIKSATEKVDRIEMRSGMRVKLNGPDLETIDQVALQIGALLKEVPSVEPSAVVAERILRKPYLEMDIDREALARYGMPIRQLQHALEAAIAESLATTAAEPLEPFQKRTEDVPDLQEQIAILASTSVRAGNGTQIPLAQVCEIRRALGPEVIKTENLLLVGYVFFDKKAGYAEADVIEDCDRYVSEKVGSGEYRLPDGVTVAFQTQQHRGKHEGE